MLQLLTMNNEVELMPWLRCLTTVLCILVTCAWIIWVTTHVKTDSATMLFRLMFFWFKVSKPTSCSTFYFPNCGLQHKAGSEVQPGRIFIQPYNHILGLKRYCFVGSSNSLHVLLHLNPFSIFFNLP